MKTSVRIVALLLLTSLASPVRAQVAEKKGLTLEGAKRAIAAAVAEAKQKNAPGGVIAVVDEGGNLMEAVSKLKKCQEKCDFHGRKRAVADEIRVALRWRTCHANRIRPI